MAVKKIMSNEEFKNKYSTRFDLNESKEDNQEKLKSNKGDELIEDFEENEYKLFKKVKRDIFTIGFVIGVLSAISIQSIITILVLMNN